jgi:glycosyltransferase involved in cell wall biosynthesis
MKVSLYTEWNKKCGIADYSRDLVRSLEKIGLTVEITTVSDNKSTARFLDDGKRLNNADVAHIQHEYTLFTNSRVPFLFSLMSLWHFYMFSSQINIPKFITLHELLTLAKLNPLMRFLGFLLLKTYIIILKKFDHIIVHTNRFREILIHNGIEKERITVFPVPVPVYQVPRIDYSSQAQAFKRSLSIKESSKVLSIIGFVYARKGYEVALSAVKDLENCTLLIAGGPQPGDTTGYFENLVMKIKELNLGNKIRILGFLPETELQRVILITDIILAPFYDASGTSSLTRNALYQKPIIASDIPTVTELKDLGLGIELFKSRQSDDLRIKIQHLLDSKEKQHSLSELTAQFIIKYNYDSFANILTSLYKQKLRV